MDSDRYFSHSRGDVLKNVPLSAKRILSLGCGTGSTESVLVERGMEVAAIERNPHAAAVAQRLGIKIIVGEVSKVIGTITDGDYDCLICADILEHLLVPQEVLQYCTKLLSKNAVIIISVPNFRHWSIFYQLLFQGLITYKDAGILDRSHVRITTSRMARLWLDDIGFKVCNKEYIIHQRRYLWLSKLFFGIFDEFLATQVVLVGKR